MSVAAGRPDDPAVTSTSGTITHGELRDDALGLRHLVPRGATVGLRSTDARTVAAALQALEGWAAVVHLLGVGDDPEGIDGLVTVDDGSLPAAASTTAHGDPAHRPEVPTHWVVYTSGTTGRPKPVTHHRSGLARTAVRSGRAADLVWGLLYDPNRMAGLQVLLQGLTSGTHVVAPALDLPLNERLAMLRRHGVDAVSATPTLWRLMLHHDLTWPELRQITLGGEIADRFVLDALGGRVPGARIAHIFASTETGAAFTVADGKAGFPLSYLDDPPRGIRLQIRDGILHVHNTDTGAADDDGFVSTGDVVEVVDDRVVFKGRASGVVNVGGTNVWPEEVENALRSHPEVGDALVTARENPVSGNILVATVVPATDDAGDLAKRLRKWARAELPNTHVPALIKVATALDVSSTGKATR